MIYVKNYVSNSLVFEKFIAYPITYKGNQYYVELIFNRTLWNYTARIFKYREKKVFIFGHKCGLLKEFNVCLSDSCTNSNEFKSNLPKIMAEIFEQYTCVIRQESELKENEKEIETFIKQWDGKI